MPKRIRLFTVPLLFLVLAVVIVSDALAQGFTGYYRYPAIHGTTVVFTAEGDLWLVDSSGGAARRVTTHAEDETHPVFSPDGKFIAFSASYEGPRELYVVSVEGGSPTRLTYEGQSGTRPVGWTPDGRILYRSGKYSTLPGYMIVSVDPNTGERDLLPLAQAATGSYDSLQENFFFTRLPRQSSNARRYKGGSVEQIWRFSTDSEEAVGLTTDFPGTSKQPSWWEGRIYFLTDRDGAMNIWSMLPDGSGLEQHTRHSDFDIQDINLQAGRIVYQLGADLRLFDIRSGVDNLIPVTLTSDLDQLRIKWETNPSRYLSSVHISNDGDRVVFTARGEVFVAPVQTGRFVHVSRNSGIRFRLARFSDDGTRLLTLSDESSEIEWWSLPADGIGDRRQITHGGKILRYDGSLSPDGTWLVHADRAQVLWLTNIATGETREIARGSADGIRGLASWSPDSKWLAYAMPDDNQLTRIYLYAVESNRTVPITTERYDSFDPSWSGDGKFVYFRSSRSFRSSVGSPWGSRQPDPYFDKQTLIYAIALDRNAEFPFDELDELSEKVEKSKKESSKDEGSDSPVETVVNEDGIMSRLYQLPVPAGNYRGMESNGSRLFWMSSVTGSGGSSLQSLELKAEAKPITITTSARSFELSADGKKVLVMKGSDAYVLSASAGASAKLDDAKVDVAGWKFPVDPRREWKQMFVDTWRLHRDWFWDENMSGVDWKGMLDKYSPLVERVASRGELSDLEAQMVSELSTLHSNVAGGDHRPGTDDVSPAALGARFSRDAGSGGFRIDHIYRSDPDIPSERSPLDTPGVQLAEGDVIMSINGVSTIGVVDIGALLQDQAGKQVRLEIRQPDEKKIERIVTAISQRRESDLRYDEWEYTRRLMVEAMGDGDIGYVHLRAMGSGNIAEWYREYYPVFDRKGLILDVRHNRGGNIDSWILGKLLRRAWFYFQGRHDKPTWNMQYAFRGHMVVLVNERTASDGEAFADGFRRLGLGEIIGTRTWGGEIWLSGNNRQVDGGVARASETGVYGPEGEWLIEGHGVDPDYVVDNLPHETFNGEDAQLKAAVEHLRRLIEQDPRNVPPPPPYPDKSK